MNGGYIETYEMIQTFILKFDTLITKNLLNSTDEEVVEEMTDKMFELSLYNIKLNKKDIKDSEDFSYVFKLQDINSAKRVILRLVDILEDLMISVMNKEKIDKNILGLINLNKDYFGQEYEIISNSYPLILELVNVDFNFIINYLKKL